MASYWKAHRFEPRRAEPLFRIAYQLAIIGHYESARILSRVARALPFPDATYSFYIEPLIYRCWLKKLYADSCWNSGEIDEALCLYEELQSEKALSQEAIEQVKFCLFLPPEKRGALIKKFHF